MVYIQPMNLAALDLNLLVALDALLAEGHVGRAASRVGLSQPAMSHALRRLRDIFSDPLMVRVGARMEFTPRADSLRAPLAVALQQVRGLFRPDAFDPLRSERRFVMMMPDLVVDLLMPSLAVKVGERAPGVALEVIPWMAPGPAAADVVQAVDIILSCIGDGFQGFHRQTLYVDQDVLAVRGGHPVGARLASPGTFTEARHIAVVGRGASEDMIDGWLRKIGMPRRIAVTLPSYLQALHLAARTDLVAFVPRRLIRTHGAALALMEVTPPADPGMDEQYLFYPTRAQLDPGSIWLRGLMDEVAREITGLAEPARAVRTRLSRPIRSACAIAG
jgi:DNA-binding transcriptional LysR family regulator